MSSPADLRGDIPVRGLKGFGLLPAALLAAVPAWANDKQDFVLCDELTAPGKRGDGIGAPAAVRNLFAQGVPQEVVQACTRALASPRLLSTQPVRRAHLLRARAAARLQLGETAEALADLDAAEAAVGGLYEDRFFKRSMWTSITLLRAIALAMTGETARAIELAEQAAVERPHALAVQKAAAGVLQSGRPVGRPSPSPWQRVARLDPDYGMLIASQEAELGNFAAVAALETSVAVPFPAEPVAPWGLAAGAEDAQHLLVATIASLDFAYAHAATGDAAGARQRVEALQTRLKTSFASGEGDARASFGADHRKLFDRFVTMRTQQVEARIAVSEGQMMAAMATLSASGLPENAATLELLTAIKTAFPEQAAALAPAITSLEASIAQTRRSGLKRLIDGVLIAPELPRAVVDYERARPNILSALVGGALSFGTTLLGGIPRTDGFKTSKNADGTLTVEFIGNTPSAAVVQEMTLLRAAEATREAGSPAFEIVRREDFERRMETRQYNMLISSTPAGYKTVLTLRPLAAAQDSARGFDAVEIIDALGPLYYEQKS